MTLTGTSRFIPAPESGQFFWDTIATCVPPDLIIASLRGSGFIDVNRRVFGGVLSEYTALTPAVERASLNPHLGRLGVAKPVAFEGSE